MFSSRRLGWRRADVLRTIFGSAISANLGTKPAEACADLCARVQPSAWRGFGLRASKKLIFSILVATIFTLSSCNPVEKVSVVEAPMPKFRPMTELAGEIVVRNDGATAVKIENASLTAFYRGRMLVTANLAEPVVAPARTTSRINYVFELENISLATLAAIPGAIADPSRVTVDVEARIRYGAIRKKINIKNMPLNKIITNFGGQK